MANKPLKSITFPGLTDTYTVPVVDNTLAVTGAAADAKKVGDEITDLKGDISELQPDPSLSTVSEKPVQNKAIANMFGNIPALSEYGNNVYEILEYLIDAVENPIDPNAIDVCLFAGQSNMDGRGTAADATPVTTGKAFKWDSTNNTVISFEAEGSLIPAYMQEYTRLTKVPLVEVKVAKGGITISQYISTYLPTAKTRLENCLSYLTNNGKTVRRVFMLWNQGESDVDGDGSTGTVAYEEYFATLKSGVMASGVNQIFIINIGQASNGTFDFAPIRTALQEVCNGTDVIMVSDKFYNATSYMNDRWHYNQIVYNIVGKDAAQNTVVFFKGGTPNIKHFDSSDIYGVPTEYGTLNDWEYELVNEKVRLTAYTGNNPDVMVYHQYKLGDYYYEARLKRSATNSDPAVFTDNTVIENVTIDNGVRFISASGIDDANQQNMSKAFKDCTSLESVMVGTDFPEIVSIEDAFNGDTLFNSFNFADKLHGVSSADSAFKGTSIASYGDIYASYSINNMFHNCASLTAVGDIKGSYKFGNDAFNNCSNLESVGTIESTALTTINRIFQNCTNLGGTVRFESAVITACVNAFYNCDLTQIIIECPADSTTYTTLSTAYPTANIVTFTPTA